MKSSKLQWYRELIDPMAEALNAQDPALFAQRRTKVLDFAASLTDEPDLANAMELLVAYHDFMARVALRDHAGAEAVYPATLSRLLDETLGPESDLTRRRYLLQLRIVADNMGLQPLPLDEFRSLFSALSFHEMHTEQWYFASNFAFGQRDVETISRAYEQFLLYRDEDDNEKFQWMRLSVMYRLLRREARPEHIERLLLSIRTAANAREVQVRLLPEIQAQGLLTPELAQLLASASEQTDLAQGS